MRTFVCTLLGVTSLALALSAQQVHVVDAAGAPGSDFVALQPAVDSASGGDILLIRPGSYAGPTVIGKALSLIADESGTVSITSGIELEGLPAASTFSLTGLDISGASGLAQPALRASICAGTLWVQSCQLQGSHASQGFAEEAVELNDCADVVLLRSNLVGGNKGAPPRHQGRSGLSANASTIWSFESTFTGTPGGFESNLGGNGGHGAFLNNGSALFTTNGTFTGAVGGGAEDTYHMSCECVFCGAPGTGGSGIVAVDSSVSVQVTSLAGAQGGPTASAGKGCSDGPDGAPYSSNPATPLTQLGGSPRGLRVSPVVREGERFTMVFFGEAGETAWLLVGLEAQALWLPAKRAPLLVDLPFAVAKPFAMIPGSSPVVVQPTMPELPPGLDGLMIVSQAFFAGPDLLSNGTNTLVLDASF
ncbi:MAG: hypothetical protein DHS20C15_25810 [Planctomycetota bacterium]|nr:MAG: hypothetical protein DHS20C15_25810 [Planctomycetota bacterium]